MQGSNNGLARDEMPLYDDLARCNGRRGRASGNKVPLVVKAGRRGARVADDDHAYGCCTDELSMLSLVETAHSTVSLSPMPCNFQAFCAVPTLRMRQPLPL